MRTSGEASSHSNVDVVLSKMNTRSTYDICMLPNKNGKVTPIWSFFSTIDKSIDHQTVHHCNTVSPLLATTTLWVIVLFHIAIGKKLVMLQARDELMGTWKSYSNLPRHNGLYTICQCTGCRFIRKNFFTPRTSLPCETVRTKKLNTNSQSIKDTSRPRRASSG